MKLRAIAGTLVSFGLAAIAWEAFARSGLLPAAITPSILDIGIALWGMIRNGRGLMPSYNRIEELDRWDVVNYVRGLQGRYAVTTGPVGLPGETGDKLPGYTQMGPTRPSPYYVHAGSQAGPATGIGGARSDSTAAAPRDTATVTPTNAAPGGAAQPPSTKTPNAGGTR